MVHFQKHGGDALRRAPAFLPRSLTITLAYGGPVPLSTNAHLQTLLPSEMPLLMTSVDRDWGLCNPGPGTILLWLEPWAEEFEIPARSTVTLHPATAFKRSPLEQVEWNEEHLVVWARAPTVAVAIDGVVQESGSASIPIPEGLTKGILGILFANQPAALLGGSGSQPPERSPWWKRLLRF